MIKILIGGSPCTHWSIAQCKARETEPEGIGWELFKNYLMAKERFHPDFFLYENNKSASEVIKDRISRDLHAPLQYINSALVSAQNRWRFYAHNFGAVPQPEDRGILLPDILESGISDRQKACCLLGSYDHAGARNYLKKNHDQMIFEPVYPVGDLNGKSYCLTSNYCKGSTIKQTLENHKRTLVAERVNVEAYAGRVVGRRINSDGHRDDYNTNIPRVQRFEVNTDPQKTNTVSTVEKDNMIAVRVNGKDTPQKVYKVIDGMIVYNDVPYKIGLPDGYYIIRKLTVTECCRLQTLPDNYCRAVSDSRAYMGLGNGWTAEVIIHLLTHALKGIPKTAHITVLSMYDGIGTGRYCFEKLGYSNITYYAYEIDKYAMQIAISNFPDIIQCGDAFQVREAGWRVAA